MRHAVAAAMALAVTLPLAACQTPEQRMATFAESCSTDYGLTRGTPDFGRCVERKEAAFMDDLQFHGSVISGAAQSYSASSSEYLARTSTPMRAPIRCTSNAVGSYLYTNCN